MFVESCLNADVWGSHSLFSELTQFFDGPWCAPLETDTVNPFVQIDGVISGHHFVDGRLTSLLSLFLGHLT